MADRTVHLTGLDKNDLRETPRSVLESVLRREAPSNWVSLSLLGSWTE